MSHLNDAKLLALDAETKPLSFAGDRR